MNIIGNRFLGRERTALYCFFRWLILLFTVGFFNEALGYNAISNNAFVQEMPAANIVLFKIDGELSEWQPEKGVLIAHDNNPDARYKALLYLAANESGLYVSARISDPTPINNTRNISQADMAWNGDAVQLRLSMNVDTLLDASLQTQIRPTPEQNLRISHLTFWFDARQQKAHFHQALGMEFTDHARDPSSVQGAYRLIEQGYQFEYFIPWAELNAAKRPPLGSFVQGQWQIHWGDATGQFLERGITDLRPINNFNDLSYHGPRSWGVVRFVAESEGDNQQGNEEPEDNNLGILLNFPTTDFSQQSIQILSDSGGLIRTLYTGSAQNEVLWDGFDDLGNPMPKGRYRARRLLHNGISTDWQCSLGDSGNPSWRTASGSGSQFGNYGMPLHVEHTPLGMLIGTGKSEAAPSLVMMREDGSNLWGSISFTQQPLTVDGDIIYQWQINEMGLARYELATGVRLDTIAMPALSPEINPNNVTKIAVRQSTLLILSDALLWLFDLNDNNGVGRKIDLAGVRDFQFFDEDLLWVANDKGLYQLRIGDIVELNVQFPYDGIVAFDSQLRDGQWRFALALEHHQIDLVDRKGGVITRIGDAPRSLVGPYERDTLYRPINIAFSDDKMWVAEHHLAPKRFSVWSSEGHLIKEIFGSIMYSPAAWWHPEESTIVYAGWGRYIFDKDARSCRYDGGILAPEYYAIKPKIPMHTAPTYFEHDAKHYGAIKQWSTLTIFEVLADSIKPLKLVEPRRYEMDISRTEGREPQRIERAAPFLYNVDTSGTLWAIDGYGFAAAQAVYQHSEPYRIGKLPASQWIEVDSFNQLDFNWFAIDERGGSVSDLFIDKDGSFYTLVSNGDIKRGEDVAAAGHRIVKFDSQGEIVWVYEDVELAFAWNSSACAGTRICAAMSFVRGNSEQYIGITGYYGQYFLLDKQTGLFVTALGEDQRGDFSYGPHMVFTENFNGTLNQGDDGEVYFFAGDVDARMWHLKGLNDREIEEIPVQLVQDTPPKTPPEDELDPDERIVLDSDKWHGLGQDGQFRIFPNGDNWVLEFDVIDDSPFSNSANDERFYFSHGDAIDIQFGEWVALDDQQAPISREAQIGDKRLIITQKGSVMLERSESGYLYQSPTGEFGPVKVEKVSFSHKVTRKSGGYYLRLTLPKSLLGDAEYIAFDAGIIFGDRAGQFSKRRIMWADQSPKLGINNDLPSQASFRLGRGVLNLGPF